MPVTYESGKAGSATIATIACPIHQWDATIETGYADSTSSNNFASGTSILWRSQVSGATQVSGTVSGYLDTGGTTASIITALLAGVTCACTLNYDATGVFFSGNVNLTNFKSGVNVGDDNTIEWSCDFKSNGVGTMY